MKKTSVLFITLAISLQTIAQSITQIGYYSKNGITAIASKGNYMILGNGNIIDNTIPSSPTLISQYPVNGNGTSVITSGDYAYFGTGMTSDLHIADISNITFPLHKSSINFTIGNGIFGMDISGNTLLAALGADGTVCSIDINDKTNPKVLDTLLIPGGQCRDIVISNNYAYAAHAGGLKIIDVSIDSNLQLISSIGAGYNCIDISGGLAFLGKTSGGIDVFDISDPTNPSPKFSILNTAGTAWDLKYSEKHLYVATNDSGLFIYKIDTISGKEMANFSNSGNGQSFGICLQDSLILLSGLINGVAILKYDSLGTTGIDNISTIGNFKLFPNPSGDYISVETDNLEIHRIKISDLSGKLYKIIESNGSDETIDISILSKGQYIISLETSKHIIRKKIIKI